jgi:hypothetical protein
MMDLLRATRPLAQPPLTPCDQWSFALRAYNGGLGWMQRDRRLAQGAGANPDDYIMVEPYNAGRSTAMHQINVAYPKQIHLFALRFQAAGWGPSAC